MILETPAITVFFFLLHRNGIKLGNNFGTCYVNSKNKIMDMFCWQNWRKKRLHWKL